MKTLFFGGSFDPVHIEHYALITNAKDFLHCDRVVVYPAFFPPHKTSLGASFCDRMDMLKASLGGLGYVVFDEIEKERGCVNYSYEVIPLLKERYPSDEYYFLIGGDSMAHFSSWRFPARIASQIKLAVVGRKDVSGLQESIDFAQKEYGADITLIPYEGKEVSSSLIKAEASLGMEIPSVKKEVADIIKERNLYLLYQDIIERLKKEMKAERYKHVCRTVLYAVQLNTALNLPFEKVFLSALLHDCTKHLSERMEGVPDQVVHQYTGAEYAKREYHIVDEEILDAIRYHTTGKKEMSTLGKLIYCADILEEGRNFEGIDLLREKIKENFEEGFLACVKSCYMCLSESNRPIDGLTKECVLYYTK